MIGSQLTRYSNIPFLLFDTETCYPSLNLAHARPWELSYAIATLDGIQSIHTSLIKWPNMVISEDNPSFRHFNRERYNAAARDPKEVWDEFSKLLYSGKYRAVGHNIIGFDCHILSVWRRALGLAPDHSWMYSPALIDTNCISKAYRASWTPDISTPNAFVAWQYRCYHTRLARGVKTRLGAMCAEFGIEYDPTKAHEAQYDIDRNWLLLKQLVWKVEC